ncbi:hypothetical protein POM88_015928 [Heracleum sosnowskyi]|uniref:TF-B3 domain-containing protein n=1 Tax=Heracleum sosnowskyi TaxID=360622 RepID=A0AAD8MSH5_9APIA|nr:hypothetical protein POM88_015928 [Heracleum sosnowskyi]
MDSTSKFVKLLSRGECVLHDLLLPHVFFEKYAAAIPLTVKLIIRNGCEIWVDFDKKNERFTGLGYLFSHFSLRGGQSLVFQYVGGFNFNVSIFGLDGSEIEYPNIVHHLQTYRPRNVSLYDGGWSFSSYLNYGQKVIDEVVIPRCFLDVVGHLLPDKLELIVSSGLHVVSSFYRKDRKISGFACICNMLGVSSLNWFNALVLKVDYITAYKDQRCWLLQIHKRLDWKRNTIHNGWIQFRDDMELYVGDVCVFRWKNDTVHNFDIEIVRYVIHVD